MKRYQFNNLQCAVGGSTNIQSKQAHVQQYLS